MKSTHKLSEVPIDDAQPVEMGEDLEEIVPAKVLQPLSPWMVAKKLGHKYPKKSSAGSVLDMKGGGS